MSRYDFKSTFGGYDDYNTFALEKHNKKELLKEYRKLRKEALHRIEELKDSEYSDSKILQNKEYLQIDPSEFDKNELVKMLSYTASFLASSQSTVEGQKERESRAVETLNALGYTEITEQNFKSFGDYMDYMKTYIENQIMGSPEMVEMFEKAVKEGIPTEKLAELYTKTRETNITRRDFQRNMKFYQENIENIEKLGLNKDRKKKYTANELRKKLKSRDMLNE